MSEADQERGRRLADEIAARDADERAATEAAIIARRGLPERPAPTLDEVIETVRGKTPRPRLVATNGELVDG